jgi:hypothetical protein
MEMELDRSDASGVPIAVRPTPVAIPLRELWAWALFGGVLLCFSLYLVGWDQGATSLFRGELVHEWMHDARHLLGVPCH